MIAGQPPIWMDFSGNYGGESGTVIDCSDIEGTNGYCDEAAAMELRRRIAPYSYEGIHILDSGSYHYLSLFWLEKIDTDFSLVLFDHHPDCQPAAFGLLSCGGWVAEALDTLPHLKKVYMVGVDSTLISELSERGELPERVCVGIDELIYDITASADPYDDSVGNIDIRDASGVGFARLPLYLSIDLDVLSTDYAACDWDNGDMTLAELTECLQRLATRNHTILGIDICGEKKNPTAAEARLNASTRDEIIKTLNKRNISP